MNEEEEKQAIQQDAPEDESVEPRASSETDDTEVSEDQTQQDVSEESETDIKNSETEERRPTRYDRRVSKLISKLKDKNTNTQGVADSDVNQLFGVNPDEPLIRPEEYETGIDPAELQRRQQAREMAIEQRIMRNLETKQQFKSTVLEHVSDAEATAKELEQDEVLDEIVTEQYNLANYTIDPYTGQEVFVPRVKMSEILAKQKKLLDRKISSAQADVSLSLRNQASNTALPPSVRGDSGRDYQTENLYQQAIESNGNVEVWAEVIKRRIAK
jgi:hypothetical protein